VCLLVCIIFPAFLLIVMQSWRCFIYYDMKGSSVDGLIYIRDAIDHKRQEFSRKCRSNWIWWLPTMLELYEVSVRIASIHKSLYLSGRHCKNPYEYPLFAKIFSLMVSWMLSHKFNFCKKNSSQLEIPHGRYSDWIMIGMNFHHKQQKKKRREIDVCGKFHESNISYGSSE